MVSGEIGGRFGPSELRWKHLDRAEQLGHSTHETLGKTTERKKTSDLVSSKSVRWEFGRRRRRK
jgi:hypothetical protein